MKYYKENIPGQGTHIMYGDNNACFHIAIMRWSDGLDPKTEKAIQDDADMIVDALNVKAGNR